MKDILKQLSDKDDKKAYEYAKKIGIESAESDKYLNMIPDFAGLLQDRSSYIRTRVFMLICNQARWANNNQIGEVFDEMIPLLTDPKPTAVRQCLKALQEVALFRPELSGRIEEAVVKIDPNAYKDSMSPLIRKDIEELRKLLG